MKVLKRLCHGMELPEGVLFVKAADEFINYPTILHASIDVQEKLNGTLQAYFSLFQALASKVLRVISFSIAWLIEGREVRASICGTLNEILKWLHCNKEIPVDHAGFRGWLETQKKWLATNYSIQNNYPDLYDLAKRDGILYLQRTMIDPNWIEFRETDEGLQYTLTIPEGHEELRKAFHDKLISPSLSFIVEKASCSRTGENYFTSSTSKVLDEDVAPLIKKASGLTAVWTSNLT